MDEGGGEEGAVRDASEAVLHGREVAAKGQFEPNPTDAATCTNVGYVREQTLGRSVSIGPENGRGLFGAFRPSQRLNATLSRRLLGLECPLQHWMLLAAPAPQEHPLTSQRQCSFRSQHRL